MQDIKKFVINLKRRPDRLETFKKNCPFTDVEVVYGFDGKYEKGKEQDITYKLKLKPGEIGVFISHLRIFKKKTIGTKVYYSSRLKTSRGID
jgi:GR25 family glycosyltransferase involved in LPS biosynthesis